MRRSLLPILILVACLFSGTIAHAQFAAADEAPVAAPPLQFGQKNTQLKNILALQAQLQLLRSLINHERAVNQMIEAAVGIGITDPVIPSPDRELCGEVPANIPCAQAYEAMYDNYSVIKKKAEPIVPLLAKMDNVIKKAVTKTKPIEPEIVFSSLYWTNITCLNGNCSAVISGDPKDPKASYRISAGEKLPDGSIINGISAAGVTVMRGKKIVTIDPAPKA